MWMAGYASRNHAASGKYCDLWVKALVLDDQRGHRALLLTFDLIGLDRLLGNTICERLKETSGWRRSQIALCMSHTHTGPVVGRNLESMHYSLVDAEQKRRIDAYAQSLVKRVVACVGQAEQRSRECRLAWGSGSASFAVNRRNNPEAQVPELRKKGALRGPSDHDVPVLTARDLDGRLMAIVFGYACHATTLSDYSWSGDYPGFAQKELEARHKDCIALFWAGCGADQNPLPRRTLELAQQYGRSLADGVESVLATDMNKLATQLQTAYQEIELPFDKLPTRDDLTLQATNGNRYEKARAKLLLRRLDLTGHLAPTYPYPVSLWRLGDEIDFIHLGGEVVVDYAVRFKREWHGPRTWVAGYSNDVMAYIPSARVLQEGGYEGATAMVYYGQPTRWAAGVEQTIITAAENLRQLNQR